MTSMPPDDPLDGLTDEEKAGLLIAGIEARGLDFDEECARIEALPTAFARFMAITGLQAAGLAARTAKLPAAGDQDQPPQGGES